LRERKKRQTNWTCSGVLQAGREPRWEGHEKVERGLKKEAGKGKTYMGTGQTLWYKGYLN
jgi:hypothetical protein